MQEWKILGALGMLLAYRVLAPALPLQRLFLHLNLPGTLCPILTLTLIAFTM